MNMVKEKEFTAFPTVLVTGDALILLFVTVTGFIQHGENPLSLRLFATLLPLWAGWALASPWLGLFQPNITSRPVPTIWRAGLASVLAVPLAVALRALLLRDPFIEVEFILALTAVTAFGLIVWRLAYALAASRSRRG